MMRRLRALLGLPVKPQITDARPPCPGARCMRCGGRYRDHPEYRDRKAGE